MPVAHHDTVRDVWLTHDSVLVNAAEPFVLEDWLRDIGVKPSKLATTARQLRDNDFDDRNLLRKVTLEELKECGIVSVGIRKCIVEAVRGAPVTPGGDDRSSMSVLCTSPSRTDVSRGRRARVRVCPVFRPWLRSSVLASVPRHRATWCAACCRAVAPDFRSASVWRSGTDLPCGDPLVIACRWGLCVLPREPPSRWSFVHQSGTC
jgi:hypothetical protein